MSSKELESAVLDASRFFQKSLLEISRIPEEVLTQDYKGLAQTLFAQSNSVPVISRLIPAVYKIAWDRDCLDPFSDCL